MDLGRTKIAEMKYRLRVSAVMVRCNNIRGCMGPSLSLKILTFLFCFPEKFFTKCLIIPATIQCGMMKLKIRVLVIFAEACAAQESLAKETLPVVNW